MTSELLLICDRIEKQESMWHLSSWATIDEVKTVAAYAKSRLQAEAQAPTTAAPTGVTPKDIQAAEMADEILAGEPTYYGDPRMHALAREYLACRPVTATTAASVLTDEESLSMEIARTRPASRPGLVRDLLAIIDRLTSTVGAPAPAPTTWRPLISELREVIEDAKARWNRDGVELDQISDQTGYIASALLGFISTNLRPAKGDTPAPTGETWRPIETAPINCWHQLWNEDAGGWIGYWPANYDPGEPMPTHWAPYTPPASAKGDTP